MQNEQNNSGLTAESTQMCPNCGGSVAYDIKSGQFKCQSCGTVIEVKPDKDYVEEYSFDSYSAREGGKPLSGVATASCPNCGAEIYFDEHETAQRCPMCGSAMVRSDVAKSGIAPEGIVPFRVDKDDARQLFRKWIAKRWFAPSELKKAYQEGALQGLYVPFWTFDAEAMANYTGQGGRTRTERDREGHTRTHTDWFPVAGSVYTSFDDILVCASEKAQSTAVAYAGPFNTISDIKPFAMQYLTGYVAERYSIDGITCFNSTARPQMESKLRSMCNSDIMAHGYSQARLHSFQPLYRNVTYKSVLVPVYTANYSWHGKEYGFAVNGESGRVKGSYPKSPLKIALVVLLAMLILFGIYYIGSQADDSSYGGGSDYYYSSGNYGYGGGYGGNYGYGNGYGDSYGGYNSGYGYGSSYSYGNSYSDSWGSYSNYDNGSYVDSLSDYSDYRETTGGDADSDSEQNTESSSTGTDETTDINLS